MRTKTDVTRRKFKAGVAAAAATLTAACGAAAQTTARIATVVLATFTATLAPAQDDPIGPILITNVNIFDGVNEVLINNASVIIDGKLISSVSTEEMAVAGGRVIDGGGRTLIPGLIDAHSHLMQSDVPFNVLVSADLNYITLVQGQAVEKMLMRGWTSFRDLGGPVFGLKRAIDEGVIPGPRIWPSGAIISQTSGHGDFRSSAHDLPALPSRDAHFTERWGFAAIADGKPAVLRAVREELMKGASQIKLMAGGGVSSSFDPLDVVQYTEDEMRAAVEAAASWNTYVTVHAYTPQAIQQAIRAGVKVIEHAQLIDEETMRMAAKAGVWMSMQPFLDDEDAIPFPEGSESRKKFVQMTNGTDTAYKLAKKHGLKIAFGTDVLFDAALAAKQGKQLAKMTRWFSPFEVLRMATSVNGELLALSGPRSPYQAGPVGVIKAGAYADLILVDGNPLADINLVADPEANFDLIMKDGVIFKNELPK